MTAHSVDRMRVNDRDRGQLLADRLKIPADPADTVGPAHPSRQPPSARLRASPDRSNVRILAVIGVVAILVAAGYLLLARPRPHLAPRPVASASLVSDSPSAAPVAPVASSTVVVHVLCQVRH